MISYFFIITWLLDLQWFLIWHTKHYPSSLSIFIGLLLRCNVKRLLMQIEIWAFAWWPHLQINKLNIKGKKIIYHCQWMRSLRCSVAVACMEIHRKSVDCIFFLFLYCYFTVCSSSSFVRTYFYNFIFLESHFTCMYRRMENFIQYYLYLAVM